MEETEDSCSVGHEDDTLTTTPVQPVPCDAADDQSAPPTSPGKPEVDGRSPRELVVTSPEAGADAAGDKAGGVTCDLPASPIGAVSEQERVERVEPSVPRCSAYRYHPEPPLCDVTMTSSFGESHVTRLQSFVDSVAAAADEATSTTCWSSRGRLLGGEAGLSAPGGRSLADLRKPRGLATCDEPLDLSVKHPPARHPDPTSSVAGEMSSFPFPVVPPLLPLLACRESWIAHWAALAAASLQHSLLFPPPALATSMTSSQPTAAADTTSGMTSSSPRSSSSSSSPKMADELRRRTALTAMESFVEGSFKPRQQQLQQQQQRQSSRHHNLGNRKRRRRHLGPEVSSSGDEEVEEKRKRRPVEINSCRAAKDQSVSPRSDDMSPTRDDVAEKRPEVTSQSKPEVNGGGEVEYLSCSARYDGAANEHPLVSLEKFVGVSTPLFRSLASPPSVTTSNGYFCATDAKTTPGDVAVTSYGGTDSAPEATVTSSRSMRGDVAASGSLGRGFSTALSLLCCNL